MTQTRQRKPKQARPASQATRTVIYLRVSTDEQARSGYGLDAQREMCEAYCKLHGDELVATLTDEGLSGSLPVAQREALANALTMCMLGQADAIVAYAQDRYARDTGVWSDVRATASRAGAKLLTVKENQDFTSKESQFMGDIHAAVAAQERRTIAERLYGGRRQKAKQDGRGSGPIPYGYVKRIEVVGDVVKSHVEIDQDAAKVIRAILRYRDEGLSYRAIAPLLTDQGYERPKGGTEWSHGNVQQICISEQLYRTGVRTWDDVQSQELWPIIHP